MSTTDKRVLRVLWAGAMAVVILGSLLPGTVLPGAGRFDKLLHVAGYAVVMLLPTLHERWRAVLACLAGSVLLGLALELAQMWSPGRFFEPADVAANTWGALLGFSAGAILRPQVLPPSGNPSSLSGPS